jgi:hypothetical protein
MIDAGSNNAGDVILESSTYEDEIRKSFRHKQKVSNFRYPYTASSIIVPRIPEYKLPERIIHFTDLGHRYKSLLYRAIIAAFNYTFTDEFAAPTSKIRLSNVTRDFVPWLNEAEISNQYSFIKDYEAYCFDKRDNHGGESALLALKSVLYNALNNEDFRKTLSTGDVSYLVELRKVKVSPNLNKKQISLASYFGALDWLRREDVGVGNELYQVLASPKLVINSLKCTASSIITELYSVKVELRRFMLEHKFCIEKSELTMFNNMNNAHTQRVFVGKLIYDMVCKYHEKERNNKGLRRALELVMLSNVTTYSTFKNVIHVFDSIEETRRILCNRQGGVSNDVSGKTYRNTSSGHLLSLELLQILSDESKGLPVTGAESFVFSWLMASLSVQPSDIAKLSKQSFRFLKIGNRVTHVECEYFKGRSNSIHRTRTVSTRSAEGKALCLYLEQNSGESLSLCNGAAPGIHRNLASLTGGIVALLSVRSFVQKIHLLHRQSGQMPIVFPSVLKALIMRGEHVNNIASSKKYSIEKRRKMLSESETPCATYLFGLQAIKNTAVHAYSDPYTLHYLINRNSHSNLTEKLNYLTPDNEEWINACGRTTRNVMLDLINNVFTLDFGFNSDNHKDKVISEFNNEFASVTAGISFKSGEMLSRLKVVTNQGKGVINEIGVLSLASENDGVFPAIYVLDSPVTVFRFLNYLYEFKTNNKKLLNQNPAHFYQTVLPNVEWIEQVLTRLSKGSIFEGERLFENMKNLGTTISVFHSI